MANRPSQSDDFSPDIPPVSVGVDEKEERILRRSEVIARERNLASRRISTETTGQPLFVQDNIKRKRRPPKVPWKKPPDMPKRPLSAYNLFFAYERERLLSEAASKTDGTSDTTFLSDVLRRSSMNVTGKGDDNDAEGASIPKVRRHTKTSGIGFANLAKTIGNKWRSIEPQTRAFFEERASGEKLKYVKEMNRWRAKQPKGKQESDDDDQKRKAKPRTTKRRQSSPPERRAEDLPNSPSRILERRASEPLPSPAYAFTFDKDVSARGSDSSSWIEPMDGGSLGSLDPYDWEDTLDFDSQGEDERPTPRRTLSDSMLHIRPESFDVRPCEDLVADVVGHDRRRSVEETKDTACSSSLRALKESLDDDMVDFITTLGKPDDERPFRGM